MSRPAGTTLAAGAAEAETTRLGGPDMVIGPL
jgi:hypothetical protein